MSSVKSYNEYLEKLRGEFCGLTEMPSNDVLESFICDYNLYEDWDIVSSEVRSDIHTKILNSKSKKNGSNIKLESGFNSKRKKHIFDYKDYLIELKRYFDLNENISEFSSVEEFIDGYSLYCDWGISSDLVKKDLMAFREGKYKEMLEVAFHKPVVYKPTRYSYKPKFFDKSVTSSTLSTYTSLTPASSISSNLNEKKASVERQKSMPMESEKNSPEKKKCVSTTNKNVTNEKTILIDGDNHIDKGLKGIEHTKKEVSVKAFFSQEGAKRKFDEKFKKRPNISSKFVKPGNQAVDNKIKTDAGKLLQKGNQDVVIVSHDKGFDEYNKKVNGKNGNRIIRAESVGSGNGK